MKTRKVRFVSMLAAAILAAPVAFAEDTDIFSGSPANGANPNVLIILDNAKAWDGAATFTCPTPSAVLANNAGKDVGFEQCSLYQAITTIGNTPQLLGKLNIGLMMFGTTAVGGSTNWGGMMKYPGTSPYNLPTMDATGIAGFSNYIKTIDRTVDGAGSSQVGGGMYEAYSFFTGRTSAASNISYTSHLNIACQRNFIIYIANALNNGNPQDTGQNTNNQLASAVQAYNGPSALNTQINTSYIGPYTKYDANWGDEWARFLYQTNFSGDPENMQNIITYTISVTDGTNPDYVQFDKSMANAGGGKSFVVTVGDVSGLIDALLKIFNEVAATNTAFASSSLPVNANTQGTFLNQVFIGMFRPDGSASPRWAGNLKQYQFGVTGTAPNQQLFLADATGAGAISAAGTGFFSANAQSFWTSKDTTKLPDSIGGFWLNQPNGVAQGYDLPDGEWVMKGGAAQQLRLANLTDDYVTNPTSPRNVYTCTTGCGPGSSLSGTPFATTNTSLTASAFGITNATYTAGVTSISRNSSGMVTVNLGSTPSPTISDPTQVTISGSTNAQYDYSLASTSPSASGSTITYTLPAEYPPMPPTASYKVTGPGAGTSNVTSLTRNSETGWFLGTAVLSDPSFNAGSGVAVGDTITFSNSVGGYYDGSNATVVTVTGGNTVTFRKQESPGVFGGGGKISDSSGNDTVGSSAGSPPGLVRGTSCSGCAANSGNVLMVTVPGGTKKLNPSTGPLTSGMSVNLSGVSPVDYGLTGLKVIGTGTSCSVSYVDSSGVLTKVTGTADSGSGRNTLITSICVDLTSGFNVFPSTSGNGAQSTTIATRQSASLTRDIQAFSVVTASNCPTTANETVQVTTAIPHGFSSGSGFTISGTGVPSNEAALVGSNKAINVTGTDTFTYTVATTPSCSDNKRGMKITYQNGTGSIDPQMLVRWVRGEDNVGDEQSPGNGITIRPSVHGDVLHSRPTVVNYGTTTGVVVYYGANDGTFRAVNGNQPLGNGNPIGGAAPGGEIWSFIAPEFFTKLQRLYSNSPQIKLANTPDGITPTPLPKDYFFDGSTGVYQSGSTVYLILSGRRGTDANGHGVLYGLDVSTPSNPKFMWKHVGGEAGFEELGQAWSTPKVALVKGYTDGSGNPKPVVIFGGGYDTNQDSDPPASNDTIGRAIFVLDAATGDIVWKAAYSGSGTAGSCTTTGTTCSLSDMTFSIPADITLLNRDFDLTNYIDRLYAADIGGNIWRVDLEPSAGNAPANWKVTKFASLGGTGTPKRKFFFPPDVVPTKEFDMVMAGTGDREHPLYSASSTSSYAVHNRFYGLKDPNVGRDVAAGWSPITDATSSTGTAAPSGLTHVVPPSSLYDPATADSGFYIDMPNTGEKIVNAPTTVGGFTYFGSNTPPTPDSQVCTNEGTARGYQVNFLTGATNSSVLDSKGLPPSPVAGLVTINVDGVDQTFPFLLGANPDPGCTGPDCKSGFGGSRPPVPIKPVRKRVYWYVDKHDN